MSAGVLFDTAGPATRARHRIYSIVSGVALLVVVAFLVYRMQVTGQFEYDKWEPFVTPRYIEAILVDGLLVTLQMAVSAIVGAVVFGLVFGMGKLSDHRAVRWPCWLVVEFFRAVPVILLIVFCFYAVFGGMDPLSRRTYWAVVMALTLYNGAVLAEVFRAGVLAVPKGQQEASSAVGLTRGQTLRLVLMPQAIRSMLPTIISQLVVVLKDTALGFVIGYQELLYKGNEVARTPRFGLPYIPVAIVLGLIYIALCSMLSIAANVVERRTGARVKPMTAFAETVPTEATAPDVVLED